MEDSQSLVQKQFGSHADDYATSSVHASGASLARLVELAKPQKDWVVLDVSTGAGHTALALAPLVVRVVATDLTAQMLDTAARLARERGFSNVEFKSADAMSLPFGDSIFDLVSNRLALHHYPDARKGIAEMARVSKQGGLVALVDNIAPPDKQLAGYINHFEKLRDPSHNWAYPSVRLQSYLTDAGLVVEHAETITKDMEFDPWADRIGASAELKAKLRKLILEAPEGVRAFLTPRTEGDKMFFALHEVILMGRKG